MKINAKLGGQTARAIGAKSGGPAGAFTAPTAIIGADVSHASPGAETPSMAAMTLSMDRLGIRYAAGCETNGFRVEMIQTEVINSLLKPMLQSWVQNVGGGSFPQRIIYFRDGVSEGQYQHVLQQEVHDMKALIKTANPSLNVPFIVVVGGKRHHVRLFPEKGKGDRKSTDHRQLFNCGSSTNFIQAMTTLSRALWWRPASQTHSRTTFIFARILRSRVLLGPCITMSS